MNSNKGTVPETSAERAVADVAAAKFQDYQRRWAPLQQRMADTINRMGAPGSHERGEAEATGAADTGLAFDKTEQKVEASQRAAGINTGSSASKLARLGVGTDKAAALGIGKTSANQTVDDAYISGLTSLMNIGRGKEAIATRGMGAAAGISANQAMSDAEASAAARASNYEMAGTVAGMAGRAYTGRRGGIPYTTDYSSMLAPAGGRAPFA
jgi:hypothetical protein